MNNYTIPAPHSNKGGKKYWKVEIQSYKYNKEKNRSDRIGKMLSIRFDDENTLDKLLNIIGENFTDGK